MANGREDTTAEETGILLGVLSAVERDSAVTQRNLARELNIALGLANAYLKRCAKKGWIKMREAPLNRYAYYLTPHGFAEKSRLTADYLSYSLDFFRRARRDCAALMGACQARGWRRVMLYGGGDLAEIAVLSAAEAAIDIAGVIDTAGTNTSCAGRPVLRDVAAAVAIAKTAPIDALIVTAARNPQPGYEQALAAAAKLGLAADRVLTPQLLRIVLPAKAVQ